MHFTSGWIKLSKKIFTLNEEIHSLLAFQMVKNHQEAG